jgi:hypothetical protein
MSVGGNENHTCFRDRRFYTIKRSGLHTALSRLKAQDGGCGHARSLRKFSDAPTERCARHPNLSRANHSANFSKYSVIFVDFVGEIR